MPVSSVNADRSTSTQVLRNPEWGACTLAASLVKNPKLLVTAVTTRSGLCVSAGINGTLGGDLSCKEPTDFQQSIPEQSHATPELALIHIFQKCTAAASMTERDLASLQSPPLLIQ